MTTTFEPHSRPRLREDKLWRKSTLAGKMDTCLHRYDKHSGVIKIVFGVMLSATIQSSIEASQIHLLNIKTDPGMTQIYRF